MSRRGWTLGLLLAVSSLNILDRSIVNILAQDIKTDLHISDAQLGLLTGTSFGVLYALMGLPLGRLADRVNRVHLIATAVAVWSAFTAICGLAANYAQLFLARAGVAVGEAGSSPASVALVSELFPEGRRASALAIVLLGGPIGGFLGFLIGGLVGGHAGWRAAFIAAGIPGLLVAAVVLVALRDPAPPKSRPTHAGHGTWLDAVKLLTKRPQFLWIALAHTCTTFLVNGASAWLAPIFIRVHGMSTAQIGTYAAFAVGTGGVVGVLGGGLVCDFLRDRGVRHAEVKLLSATLGLSVIAMLTTALSPAPAIGIGAMFVLYALGYSYLGPGASLIQSHATPETRGLAQAICLSMSVILNLGAGLPLVGALSDALRPQHGPLALAYALAIGSIVMGSIGLIAYWRVYRISAGPAGLTIEAPST